MSSVLSLFSFLRKEKSASLIFIFKKQEILSGFLDSLGLSALPRYHLQDLTYLDFTNCLSLAERTSVSRHLLCRTLLPVVLGKPHAETHRDSHEGTAWKAKGLKKEERGLQSQSLPAYQTDPESSCLFFCLGWRIRKGCARVFCTQKGRRGSRLSEMCF